MANPSRTLADLSFPEGGRAATSIVATLGPSTEECLGDLIDAGLSVARINFSHSSEEEHRRRVAKLREEARKRDAVVGILGDIPGPKIRLGRLDGGSLELERGAEVAIGESAEPAPPGELVIELEGFAERVKPGDRVFLGDAAIELLVDRLEGGKAIAEVRRGGTISDRKGVHLPDTPLAFEVPTRSDRRFIELARELELDMLGISFVSRAEEVERVRGLAPDMLLVAKIERKAALENLDGILTSADGLMVARGDLGVELDFEHLPIVQKSLIQAALRLGKFTITATEMLESMVSARRPTRAEVTDVANAVLDGTDAVMLSAETAVGEFPIDAVRTMARIASAVETSERYQEIGRVAFRTAEPTFSNAVAMAAVQAAEALGIRKIVCFTESGDTVRLLSRYRPQAEILALSPNETTLRRITVLAHVRPVRFERITNLEDMLAAAQDSLVRRGLARHGEEVVLVAGVPVGVAHSTNVMKLHRIGAPMRMH